MAGLTWDDKRNTGFRLTHSVRTVPLPIRENWRCVGCVLDVETTCRAHNSFIPRCGKIVLSGERRRILRQDCIWPRKRCQACISLHVGQARWPDDRCDLQVEDWIFWIRITEPTKRHDGRGQMEGDMRTRDLLTRAGWPRRHVWCPVKMSRAGIPFKQSGRRTAKESTLTGSFQLIWRL